MWLHRPEVESCRFSLTSTPQSRHTRSWPSPEKKSRTAERTGRRAGGGRAGVASAVTRESRLRSASFTSGGTAPAPRHQPAAPQAARGSESHHTSPTGLRVSSHQSDRAQGLTTPVRPGSGSQHTSPTGLRVSAHQSGLAQSLITPVRPGSESHHTSPTGLRVSPHQSGLAQSLSTLVRPGSEPQHISPAWLRASAH